MYVCPLFVVIVPTDDRAMDMSELGRCSRRTSVSGSSYALSRPRQTMMLQRSVYGSAFFTPDSSGGSLKSNTSNIVEDHPVCLTGSTATCSYLAIASSVLLPASSKCSSLPSCSSDERVDSVCYGKHHPWLPLLVLLRRPDRLAATLGAKSSFKKLPKRSVLTADISQLCGLIAQPPEPLALRLSSNLMMGVAR